MSPRQIVERRSRRWTTARKQRSGVQIERQRRVDRTEIAERRERPLHQLGRESLELEVRRRELGVGRDVVMRGQEAIVLPQDEADLVELGLPDAMDARAERRGGERARLELVVDRRVKYVAPGAGGTPLELAVGVVVIRMANEKDHCAR